MSGEERADCQHDWQYYEWEYKVFGGMARFYEQRRRCRKCWRFERSVLDLDRAEPLGRPVYKWIQC